ncbi:MAG: hypothetical protein LBP92_05520 [Deltaproteobacteria bacterium]|jgi:hypothetical protein|nr:hypothetical protein [Deltaproteobacteria bacterium]
MIVSFVRGRIRARLTHLKGQDVPPVPAAGTLKGVKTLTINPLTGGVLLEYDPEAISVEEIASFLEPLDPEGAATLRNPWLLKPRGLFARAVEVPPELLSGEAREAAMARRPRPRGSARATSETINLATAFLSCVASAFWGSVRTHTLCGAGLGVLIAQHIWRHRRRLRPLGQMGLLEILGIELPKLIGPPLAMEEPEPDGEDPEGS